MRSTLISVALASTLACGFFNPVLAADEYNVTTGYTLDGAGLGVHGVDTVVLSTMNAVAPAQPNMPWCMMAWLITSHPK